MPCTTIPNRSSHLYCQLLEAFVPYRSVSANPYGPLGSPLQLVLIGGRHEFAAAERARLVLSTSHLIPTHVWSSNG